MSSKVEHGRTYVDGDATFRVAGADSEHKGKIVEIIDGKEYRPWDISITKNVLGLFIAVVLVIWSILDVLDGTSAMDTRLLGSLQALSRL